MKKVKMNISDRILSLLIIIFTILSLIFASNVISFSNILLALFGAIIAPNAAFSSGLQYINSINAVTQHSILGSSQSVYSFTQVPILNQNNQQNSQQANQPSTQYVDNQNTNQDDTSQLPTEEQLIPSGAISISQATYTQGTTSNYVQTQYASILNVTSLTAQEISAQVLLPLPFEIQFNSNEPQVLIMHTHTTETFELEDKNYTYPEFTARSTDNSINISAVGQVIATQLNNAGINTLHDTTLHDYPSYNGSYDRSYETVQQYLTQYPSIKVVIDVHRDAIQKQDGTRIKPVAEINGQQAAQVMIISCADYDGNIPNYMQNLTFAANWQDEMEKMYPGLTRPVLFDYRYYNQDLTTGSLLLEVGGHANTLQEALYSAQLVANSLVSLFLGG